ncbi:Protein CBG26322 [Caenorhabditis briggsae]|uniref:Protein CBG26322 n=1 Tax=Caenorhabditis briggsae TaxID=6238 RepID=B6IG94_CAEBR|nr:Protein CBG26322 [Caenorhabditis briggsae]CAR98924.1 Protein CBG26322 [Caenorhabditis briggsae]
MENGKSWGFSNAEVSFFNRD